MDLIKKIILFVYIICLIPLSGQIPEAYYDGAQGKSGMFLKEALYNIIKEHQEYPYTSYNTDTWDILKQADMDTANPANVILLYTGIAVDGDQEWNEGEGWSREHVWAKSHGYFGTSQGAGTDTHNLRPCDPSVNTARSNKDFDNGGSYYIFQDSITTDNKYTKDTWEPRDAVKGDVARTMFYMAVRYEGRIDDELDLELVDIVPTEGPLFGKLSTLIDWHHQDPVDTLERRRNDIIYGYQNNRNPFIDHPEYADSIWADGKNPVIIKVDHYPSEPMASEEVRVEVKLIDPQGIADVKLNWKYNDILPPPPVKMEKEEDYYFTTIPAQAAGDSVYYQITAKDNQGNMVTSIEYGYFVKEAFVEKTILEETFDSSLGQMSQYSIDGAQKWEWEDDYGEPPGCAKMSGYDGTEYQNRDWLITPAFDLSGFDKATLEFEEAINYDDNIVSYSQSVRISSDYPGEGNPENYHWDEFSVTGRSSGSSWDFVNVDEVDLSDSSGVSDLYLGFRYTSSNSSASTWEIDNILIKAVRNTASDIDASEDLLSRDFELYNNYPNPFNSSTTIQFYLDKGQPLNLEIYDITGKLVESITSGYRNPGVHQIKWQAMNQASGVYFIKLSGSRQSEIKKCLLIK